MTYSVYAISSIDRNYIYVGFSSEPLIRIDRHNSGNNKTTAPYAPFLILMIEEVGNDRGEARALEKYWKSGIGKKKLRSIKDKI
ncbi:GIY-YIG nuclease family protein [Nonlabens antarcticus]|uniref:GIY-YIG nuclease family protein n=1 Tax=Nonlabens antarcticus TaxID=392714 RepID=UPI001891D7A9|nr:GIY-YIG nuclease family protein [Nonlabens antarcticus]